MVFALFFSYFLHIAPPKIWKQSISYRISHANHDVSTFWGFELSTKLNIVTPKIGHNSSPFYIAFRMTRPELNWPWNSGASRSMADVTVRVAALACHGMIMESVMLKWFLLVIKWWWMARIYVNGKMIYYTLLSFIILS